MAGKKSGEFSVFEFIQLNPDLTSGEIARAMGKKIGVLSGQLSQLYSTGRIVKSGVRSGIPTYSVNTLPFGCSNPLLLTFNQLLRGARSETV